MASCKSWRKIVGPSFLCLRISCPSPVADNFRLEITKDNYLNIVLRLLQLPGRPPSYPAVLLVYALTIQPVNDSLIIKAGFLQPLINCLGFEVGKAIQLRTAKALNNLATSTEKNKLHIVNAGAVQSIKQLVMKAPQDVQIAMIACIKNLSTTSGKRGRAYDPCLQT